MPLWLQNVGYIVDAPCKGRLALRALLLVDGKRPPIELFGLRKATLVLIDPTQIAEAYSLRRAAYYRIVTDPTLSPEARDGLRQSLLKYCGRDTLALARVHDWLIQGN